MGQRQDDGGICIKINTFFIKINKYLHDKPIKMPMSSLKLFTKQKQDCNQFTSLQLTHKVQNITKIPQLTRVQWNRTM